MAKFKDPMQIYRESLASLPQRAEDHPPLIERAEVWPYPDLQKLWLRLQVSPFASYPNLACSVYDAGNNVVATMFVVELREPYQSLTLHLRLPPRPGERYRLELELTRAEAELDRREIEFDLIYRDPEQARKEGKSDG